LSNIAMRAATLGLLLLATTSAVAQPGDIDRTAIRDEIRRHVGEVRHCYERALAAGQPDLAGRVVIRFTIIPAGKPIAVTVQESELPNPAFESCVAGVFRRMRFPPFPRTSAPIHITYPLMFRS
jgi:TonB family protein